MTASILSAAALFASTFILVFALGWQSRNVNGDHYLAAFFTSFVIGGGNIVVLKLAPDAGWIEICAFLSGGPFGIIAAMWSHKRTFKRRRGRWK